MKKKQLVIVHGGDAYDSYSDFVNALKTEEATREDFKKASGNIRIWRDDLGSRLARTHEVFQPRMPNKDCAKYSEWKVWFEKLMPYIGKGAVFVGHSMGGIFLVKYFAEKGDLKRLDGLFLVAAPFDDKDSEYSLSDFALPNDLSKIRDLGSKVHLYFSKDDNVVPFADLAKYQKAFPQAKVRIFSNKGHFKVNKLPEILRDIKQIK